MAKRTVMAFGSFDILHPGHVHYLERAASLGDRLIVIVARDSNIAILKKRPPAFKERDRLHLISSLKFVDKAVLGNRNRTREDFYRIILKYKPKIIALGYDQKVNVRELSSWLDSRNLHSRIVRIRSSLNPRSYKSSIIRGHIAG
ncbi:MAG: FAD synthase [Candidatus Micrarchaeota archaeon]|nr:FAD synthase [Candidatus Micrarchaeota archaeon]